jgi:2-keto-3-deoxy-6-phosphogluconate aldolase
MTKGGEHTPGWRDIGRVAVIRGPSADVTLQTVEALVAGGV